MDVIYHSHAVERMISRNISTHEVEFILSSPDGKIKQSRDKYIYFKELDGLSDNKIAAVALLKQRNFFEVLTVMIHFEVLQ